MAEPITAVVDPVAGVFCDDGMAPGRIVVSVADNPSPRLHRYSGDPESPIRDATALEIAAYDEGLLDSGASLVWDSPGGKALRAAVAAVFWQITGALPTPTQVSAMRTKFKTVFRAL